MPVMTFRKLAQRWAVERVIPALGRLGPEDPRCYQSLAAQTLLDDTTITVNLWKQYPGPPASFLDYEWESDWLKEMGAFGYLDASNPCSLNEDEVLSRIIAPALMAIKDLLPGAFKFKAVGNMVIFQEEKIGNKTTPDLAIYVGQWLNGHWDGDGPHQAFVGKAPLADLRLNGALDAFFGKTVQEHQKDGASAGATKILGQVLEACSGAQLRFGLLLAPPFLFRPVYLDYQDRAPRAEAFLGCNCIPRSGDVKNAETWETFFCELMWFMFCVWVKGLKEAGEKMEQHPKWKEWADNVKQTLHPGENEVAAARKRPIALSARYINVMQHFLFSIMFALFGPSFVFAFLKSFAISPVQVPSIITYPKRWTRFTHAIFPPDSVIPKDFATVCIYHQWGFVVKYAYDQEGFTRELRALQGLASMDRSPSLLAHGSTRAELQSTSIPFLVMTYHGDPLLEFDTPTVNLIYHRIIKPMHDLGWHHHDIKPDNVTRDIHGNLYIIDFNLAKPRIKCQRACPDRLFLRKWGIIDDVRD